MMQVIVINEKTKRDIGKRVQHDNVYAAKTIAELVRTCLGPHAMLKMLMDPMGGVVLTNDGNAILREITVKHPTAKIMIEIARTQDEEVGDGTTSVIMLTGEILSEIEKFIPLYHPVTLIKCMRQALDDIVESLPSIGRELGTEREEMEKMVKTCLGTKLLGDWSDLACKMALDAVNIVLEDNKGTKRIDIKNNARIEKIPGGIVDDSCVVEGIVLNKDVVHSKMPRRILNPKILLLDCTLEYKKGESKTNVEVSQDGDFTRLLEIEEEYVRRLCDRIIAARPDLVCTEKGISDLAIHYLTKAGISALRRLRKTDNNRLGRAVGATIVSRLDELQSHHIGTGAGLFEVRKIGDEYFSFITNCTNPKACTLLLRGPSKDVLNEIDRNLNDALNVARNLHMSPRIVPGGGAVEMMVQRALFDKNPDLTRPVEPYSAVYKALEVIPRTLIQNSGAANVVRLMGELESSHARSDIVGVDGTTGELVNVENLGVWEPLLVKQQVYKTAIETAILILKIDEIVSGAKKRDPDAGTKSKPTIESIKE